MSIIFQFIFLLLSLLLAKIGATIEECADATLIQGSGPFSDDGSTSQASPVGEDSSATTCSSITSSTRGVWYLMRGDDHCYTASTDGSAIDTVLAVYITPTGCEALSCLAENDDVDKGNSASEVSWTAIAGVDYYILVAGFSNTTGQYKLTVSVRHLNCSRFGLVHVYDMLDVSPLLNPKFVLDCYREKTAQHFR